MSKTVYSFDFDGTITDCPGEESEIYSSGCRYRLLHPEFIYVNLKNVFQRSSSVTDIQSLKSFFKVLQSDPNNIVTIQTRNYKNVVLAYLYHHVELPGGLVDEERSVFRESDQTKIDSLQELCNDPSIGQVFFFEDTKNYLKDALQLSSKVKIINCKKGKASLCKLLQECPVVDENSLQIFLNKFATDTL